MPTMTDHHALFPTCSGHGQNRHPHQEGTHRAEAGRSCQTSELQEGHPPNGRWDATCSKNILTAFLCIAESLWREKIIVVRRLYLAPSLLWPAHLQTEQPRPTIHFLLSLRRFHQPRVLAARRVFPNTFPLQNRIGACRTHISGKSIGHVLEADTPNCSR